VRIPWPRQGRAVESTLPMRELGTNLPEWTEQQTYTYPTLQAGRADRLTSVQAFRADRRRKR
jgi:hypothetical protein